MRPARGPGWRIASLLLAYLLLVVVTFSAWRLLNLPPQSHKGTLHPGLMLLSGLLLLGAILVASAVTLRRFDNRSLGTVGVPLSGPWPQQLLIGLLAGSSTPALFFLLAHALGAAQVVSTPLDRHSLLTRTLPALVSYFLLAFHEELFLRGYLMQLVSQSRGRSVAALVTGALFGLAHAGNPGANPAGLVSTAVSGVLLAWLVMRNGSLWIAGGYHTGFNATAALALGMKVSGTTMPGAWIQTTLGGPPWITGGSYGFEASAIVSLLEPALLGLLVWLAPRLPAHPELRRLFERQTRPTRSAASIRS